MRTVKSRDNNDTEKKENKQFLEKQDRSKQKGQKPKERNRL